MGPQSLEYLAVFSGIADGINRILGRMKSKEGAVPKVAAEDTAGLPHIAAGATVVADEHILAKFDDSHSRYATRASSENV
jgi:hypothetical protein